MAIVSLARYATDAAASFPSTVIRRLARHVAPLGSVKTLRTVRSTRAAASPSSAPVWRAIISSSLVGITQAETRLPAREIRGAVRAFASRSSSMPSQADASQIRSRISAEFSPMPAVNTSASIPPSTAASAPISLAAR